jgi:hypothetical protein
VAGKVLSDLAGHGKNLLAPAKKDKDTGALTPGDVIK